MAYNYEFTDLAKKGIDEAIFYITTVLSNKNAASKLIVDIENTIENICLFPMSYSNCEYYYIKDESIRHAIIKNYVLIFKIEDNSIIFLSFKYSKKDKVL